MVTTCNLFLATKSEQPQNNWTYRESLAAQYCHREEKNQFKGDDDKSRNRFRVLWKYNLKKLLQISSKVLLR
jgi:hypothetical protein